MIEWLTRDEFWSQFESDYRADGRFLSEDSDLDASLAELRRRISAPPASTPPDRDFPGPVERWYGKVHNHLFLLTHYIHPSYPRPASALTIDDFQASQTVNGPIQGPLSIQPGTGSGSCGGSICQSRFVVTDGSPSVGDVTISIGGGSLDVHVSSAPESARATVFWSLLPTDVTFGGATNAAFTFDVLAQTMSAVASIGLGTGGTSWTASVTLTGPGHYALPLASFVPSQNPSNLAAITQISLAINGSASVASDLRIGPVRLVPEPSLVQLVCAAAFAALTAGLANRFAAVGRWAHERPQVARTGRDR